MCKTGNGVMGVVLALAICVSGAASATDCDASRLSELHASMITAGEMCLTTARTYGVPVARQSSECIVNITIAGRIGIIVDEMRRNGCTAYYNLPSVHQRSRLKEIGKELTDLNI